MKVDADLAGGACDWRTNYCYFWIQVDVWGYGVTNPDPRGQPDIDDVVYSRDSTGHAESCHWQNGEACTYTYYRRFTDVDPGSRLCLTVDAYSRNVETAHARVTYCYDVPVPPS